MCASVMVCPGRVVWKRVGCSSLISPPQLPPFTHYTATLSSPPPPTRHRLVKLTALNFLPLSPSFFRFSYFLLFHFLYGKRSFEVKEYSFSMGFRGFHITHEMCCRLMRVGNRRGGDYPGRFGETATTVKIK